MTQTAKWSRAKATVADYALDLPSNIDEQGAQLIAPVPISVWDDSSAASDLVEAWTRTRGRRREIAPAVWLTALLAFESAFSSDAPELAAALSDRKMTLRRTRIEIKLQLGGRLFYFGRKGIQSDRDDPTARALLRHAMARFAAIEPDETVLSQSARRGYRGMHGIAAVLLSRTEDDADALVSLAEANLKTAEDLGDRTAGHFAYLLEAQLRRFELSGDDDALRAARATWERAGSAARERGLLATGAELRVAEARRYLATGDASQGVRELKAADALLTEALEMADGGGIDDGFLRVVRGRVRHQLFEHDTSTDGARRAHWLTLAEEDLDAPETQAHAGATTRVPVMLDRARRLQRRGEHEQALELLERAGVEASAPDYAPSVVEQAKVARLDSQVFLAVRDRDVAKTGALVEEILRLPEGASTPAAALSLAVRFLLAREGDRSLAEPAVERLRNDLANQRLSDTARRHIAGHAGRLAWMVAREDNDPLTLKRAAWLFRESLTAGTAPASPMVLADAGSCALRVAKLESAGDSADPDEVGGLLRDAASWLHSALERAGEVSYELHESFEEPLLHSRAGEAFLRLDALTPSDADLSAGIAHMEAARSLGHPWPELSGHLGDALYRRGRRRRSVDDLKAALALKDEDHAAGRTARENRSVAAAAALTLHELTGDDAELRRAAAYALDAAEQDPTWPWPALQLATAVRQSPDALRGFDGSDHGSPLRELLASGDAEGLERYAAELAARSPEFAPQPLGGQRRQGRAVYVLADGHGLLSRTLVLKRVPIATAESELKTTQEFGAYLRATEAPTTWQLPDPIAVIDHPTDASKAVYVMRRAKGVPIGLAVSATEPGREAVMSYLGSAVRFLAAFYAWAARAIDLPPTLPPKRIKRWNVDLFQRARRIGLSGADARRLASGFSGAVTSTLPALPKRDAHAANWLVTEEDALVAIDLEATSTVPPVFEVAQLIDDYPFLPPDQDGWRDRLRLVTLHLEELRARGVDVELEQDRVEDLFAWFALVHALANLGRLAEHPDDWRVSSSGRALRRRRRDHAVDLIRCLGRAAPSPALRRCAGELAERADSEARED